MTFGGKPQKQAAFVEIKILGDHGETVVCRVLPDSGVGGLSHAEKARLGYAGGKVFQLGDKFVGKVLVKQEFQAARMGSRRCSRSAANSRHARMSSRSNSG